MDLKKEENKCFRYSALHAEEVFIDLKTRPAGLSAAEAASRLVVFGPNQLAAQSVPAWRVFVRQFKSAFLYLLLGASAITFALDSRVDAAVILGFILINAVLGFYQEFRSERALEALKGYLVRRARVRRGGEVLEAPAADLVPGDIVILETGDKVPADLRLIDAKRLVLDESILTGESVTVPKSAESLARAAQNAFQARNLAFSGTSVASGYGEGVVAATGPATMMGRIARLTAESAKESNFAKGMDRFSRFILKLVAATLALLYVANLAIKGGSDWAQLLAFSIALAVSVIPEALPVVTTMSLSRGALKLAKKKVVVKRLSAIEDLGGIDLLCTDKTGTITENRMAVTGVSPGADKDLLFYAFLASDGGRKKVEPFDLALEKALAKADKARTRSFRHLETLPFDPNRRWGAALLAGPNGEEMVYRGAPETLLAHCALSAEQKRALSDWRRQRGAEGERTLAVARLRLKRDRRSRSALPHGLELLGLVAFADPVKRSTGAAVAKARELGVDIMVLTGDSVEVAGAVAHKVGLVSSPDEAITGEGLFKLPPEAQMKALERVRVVARVTPEQKHAIIVLLARQREVGFLGEGINDAPALKAAGVSLAVDGASEIAREAADIILLQKDLNVIVDGIREGRSVFVNTIKYIRSTMASNFGNFYAVAVVSLFIPFLPMLPIQLLLLNLLSDFPMIAIAADNVGPRELARPQRYDLKEIIALCTLLGLVSTVFDFLFFASFVRLGESALQTNWFIGSILTELALIYSIRSRRPFWKAHPPARLLVSLTALAALTTILVPFTGLGAALFRFTAPAIPHLALILGLTACYFACTEAVKHLYYRHWARA